jgi:hypothetical protein
MSNEIPHHTNPRRDDIIVISAAAEMIFES